MFNKKTTKRALWSSILALVLCFAMLLGTTYAWFTDSVTSANNIIKSGNLDIELEYLKNGEWVDVEQASDILTNKLWEPGVTEVAYLRMKNAGSLALKYQLGINIKEETAGVNVDGKSFLLSDYIYFDVNESATEKIYTTREEAMELATETILISDGFRKAGTLEGKSAHTYFTMVVYMPETVGNEANHNGTNIPEIKLGIDIFATQVSSENDSFGNDYDYSAPLQTAPESVPAAGNNFVLNGSIDSGVQVEIPATVMSAISNTVTSMSVVASAPVVDTDSKTVSFDTVELQDQDGNKVELSDATAKVTVTLPVGNAFADGEKVEVYHDGSFVTYATVANGKISYEVSHFCEVEIKAAEEVVLDNTIDSVKEFIAFAEAVNGGKNYAGETVVLGADLDLNGVTWTPIGTSANPFKGTFDGNGKVIKNLSVLMGKGSYVGLFGNTHDGEIKNVTVENAKVAGRLNVGVVAGQPYTTKYTNITVKGHVEVDGMAYVGAVGGKNAYADWTDITVNVDATSYVNANSVENGSAYRTYVGGVVGFNGEGAHTFKNITTNINVIGSTCDVGGAFGIAHYGNKFENVTVTGTVTCTDATTEIGGIAGVWHNQSGYTVTFTDCVYNGDSDVALIGDAYSSTGNGTLVIDGEKFVTVYTGDQLKAALADNSNVIFVDNITMAATESNAYGKTGINVKNGQTIDGNGYTLKVTDAGGTWGSAISTTGGIIKNLTVAQGFRGIFVNHNSSYSETVVLDNVTIQGPTYTISCDQGVNQNLVATNCTINGWTSYAATIGTVKFENCSFGKGAGYQFCRPYAPTEFVGCTFSAGYTIDEAYATIEYDNCVFKVSNADQLVAALEAGRDVVFANDIKIEPASMSNAYGATGINVKYGQTIDGNGYTLDIKGAGGTWDSGINTTGGVIKNLTVTGSFRGIFINHTSEHSEKVILENVTIGGNGTVYTISCDQGLYQGIEATNCTFNGWTSFAKTAGEATFVNCTFGEGSGYKYCRPYSNTEFVNCTFVEGYVVDTTRATVTFTDCENPSK